MPLGHEELFHPKCEGCKMEGTYGEAVQDGGETGNETRKSIEHWLRKRDNDSRRKCLLDSGERTVDFYDLAELVKQNKHPLKLTGLGFRMI